MKRGQVPDGVRAQYASTDPLKVRIETHHIYEESHVDLDAEAAGLLDLSDAVRVLDVGCGPGLFLAYLAEHSHPAQLVGCDQSSAMLDEGVARLANHGARANWVQGDAQNLPFRDAAFDRVVARHMLYHVPDKSRALREFARVLRTSGAALLSTNAADYLPRVRDLVTAALDRFGLSGPPWHSGGFSTENAAEMLGSVFPHVEEIIISNALVFTSAEPIVRYIETMAPSFDRSNEFWADVHGWLFEETSRRMARLGGVWRDPKDVGFYLARR